MKNPSILKFIGIVLLFGLWATLVFLGKAEAAPLVTAITGLVAGVGVHSASGPAPDANPTVSKMEPKVGGGQSPLTPV
jgi:hypothetical protein